VSGYDEDPTQCEVIQDELGELSLGILSGRRRSEALGHVGSCRPCRAELERLSILADTLLQFAPRIQPPLGFELRLAERLDAEAAHRPSRMRRLRRIGSLSVAAVVISILSFGIGALVTPGGGNGQVRSATAKLTTADLTSHGEVLGEVMISAGGPAWMFVTIDGGAWPGTVTCDVTLAGGKVETIGVFKLSGGYGAWEAPLKSPAGQVRFARLIAANGTVLATARLSV
jgi:hypothetical protein